MNVLMLTILAIGLVVLVLWLRRVMYLHVPVHSFVLNVLAIAFVFTMLFVAGHFLGRSLRRSLRTAIVLTILCVPVLALHSVVAPWGYEHLMTVEEMLPDGWVKTSSTTWYWYPMCEIDGCEIAVATYFYDRAEHSPHSVYQEIREAADSSQWRMHRSGALLNECVLEERRCEIRLTQRNVAEGRVAVHFTITPRDAPSSLDMPEGAVRVQVVVWDSRPRLW